MSGFDCAIELMVTTKAKTNKNILHIATIPLNDYIRLLALSESDDGLSCRSIEIAGRRLFFHTLDTCPAIYSKSDLLQGSMRITYGWAEAPMAKASKCAGCGLVLADRSSALNQPK